MRMIIYVLLSLIVISGCMTTAEIPLIENAERVPVALIYERHFPDHDPQDSNRSFATIKREQSDQSVLFRGTTEFTEGYRMTESLPLDRDHGIYVTMTVNGSIIEGAGSSSPGFIDLFVTGLQETLLSPYGSLFFRFEQLRDTGTQGW